MDEFRHLIAGSRLQPAGFSPFDPTTDWLQEELEVFQAWMLSTEKKWTVPRMRFHRLLKGPSVNYATDWPPPGWYFLTVLAPTVALKQTNPRIKLECRTPGADRGAIFRRRVKVGPFLEDPL